MSGSHISLDLAHKLFERAQKKRVVRILMTIG